MMRRILLASSAAFLILILPGTSHASEGFEDLVKVVKSGVTEEALLAYVNDSPIAYDLSVDEILYLRDIGLSPDLITAVVAHGKRVTVKIPVTPQADEEAMQPESQEPEPEQMPEPVTTSDGGSTEVIQETIVDAPVETAPPQDSVDYSTFYDALSPYGSWFEIDGVWYWQPTAVLVVKDWRPYCDYGQWVYTDLGWMWQSLYSWGWAPFHYGRWSLHHRYGWIWRPDSEWAPAWVTWRQCDTAIGWAPLPPDACFALDAGFTYLGKKADADCEFGLEFLHYTFVPVLDLCSPSLTRHRLARSNAARLFGTTAVVRKSLVRAQNRIVNHGPSIARVREQTHQDIKQVRIVDSAVQQGGRMVGRVAAGDSVMMFRPHVAPSAHETPREVVTRHQASVELRHERTSGDAAIRTYKSSSEARTEEIRGSTSLSAPPHPVVPGNPPPIVSPGAAIYTPRDIQKANEAMLAATRRRQTEEAAEQQRQEERQRTEAFARDREIKRQQALEVGKQRAMAEQQQRAEQSAREQEQQQAEQRARVQAEQRQAQEAARQREAQLRAFQVQRQAEEAAARLSESRQQQLDGPSQQQNGFHGYENRSATRSASTRGAASRDKKEDKDY
jgi:hypothetical protein